MTVTPPAGRPLSVAGAGLRLVAIGAAAAAAAGLVGAVAVGGVVGWAAGLGWGIGAGLAVGALGLGQAAIALTGRRPVLVSLVTALVAYTAAIAAAFGVLVALDRWTGLPLVWVGAGLAVATVAYLAGATVVFPRLRIPVYDPPPEYSPNNGGANRPDDGSVGEYSARDAPGESVGGEVGDKPSPAESGEVKWPTGP
jgi:hypothetical protein